MKKIEKRERRKIRVRKKVSGTAERPRLSIYRSLQSLYVQAIDDATGRTLLSDLVRGKKNKEAAAALGKSIGAKIKEAKIEAVVFDRNGYRYHGVVKAFADSVRETGVRF